jgi:hypothetical protein
MKYALFVVVDPTANARAEMNALSDFERGLHNNGLPDSSCEMLLPWVVLCDLNNGLHTLTKLVHLAKAHQLESRTLFFDQVPSWVVTPPSEK